MGLGSTRRVGGGCELSALYLIRHADAGEPWQFPKDDMKRPLTSFGREQARDIASALKSFGVRHIFASAAERCQQTAHFLYRTTNVAVETTPMLAPGRGHVITSFLRSIKPEPTVVCTHSDNIIAFVQQIGADDHVAIPKRIMAPSGSFWVFERTGMVFDKAIYVAPNGELPEMVSTDEDDEWVE